MFKISELLEATGGCLISGRRDALVNGISIDSRQLKPKQAFIAIKGNRLDGHNFISDALKHKPSCVIVDSEFNIPHSFSATKLAWIKVKDTTIALGDIARFHRSRFNIPIIAVTGSNGKTTTKDMIAHVLFSSFNVLKNQGTCNNHIGLPVALLGLKKKHHLAVLELGSNHFGEIAYLAKICSPNIGVITNIGHSHLEFLCNINGVLKEKISLSENLMAPELMVLNTDDDMLSPKLEEISVKPGVHSMGFGIKNNADFRATGIKLKGKEIKFKVNKQEFTLNTIASHNIYNALAAIAIARLLGLGYGAIAKSLKGFVFPKGRMNLLESSGIMFLDDTYNSNPLSLTRALDALSEYKTNGRKIFVMGDMLELGDNKESFHSQAGKAASKVCDVLVTVGELSRHAASAARENGFNRIFSCDSASLAKDILRKELAVKQGDIVLVKGSRSMRMEEIFKEE